MNKWDCVHVCKRCGLLTTCLPNCVGERKYEPRVCDACVRAAAFVARLRRHKERYKEVYRSLENA